MNTTQYAQDLKNAIDYNRYATLIESLGKQLNDRKDRFDKSDFIEQCIEVYSNGRLVWIDDIGRDHRDSVTGFDLEFKYTADGIYTKKKAPKSVIKVKIKNSLGVNKGTTIDNPADFYMIGQQDAIAIISSEELKPFLVAVPDGIEAHIPFSALTLVFTPSDISNVVTKTVNYKSEKLKAQRKIIESI